MIFLKKERRKILIWVAALGSRSSNFFYPLFFFFNISLFFFLETTKTSALINICFSFILNTST